MAFYTKKPVTIEAVEFTHETVEDCLNFLGEKNVKDVGKNIAGEITQILIPTLEGDHLACLGDYIIKGVKGEFYPCKSDIFEMTYVENNT